MPDSVQLFKALGDETRLRILNLLSHRELCVCQIVEILATSQPKVSRHLAYLRNAGLVNDRREGLWVYYSMAEAEGRLQRVVSQWLREAKDEIPRGANDLQSLEELGECDELCAEKPSASPARGDKHTTSVGV